MVSSELYWICRTGPHGVLQRHVPQMAAARMASALAAAGNPVPVESAAAAASRGHADERVADRSCGARAGVPRRVRRGHSLQRSGVRVVR